MKHKNFIPLLLSFAILCSPVQAAPVLKTFTQGSYQHLISQYKNQPFVLIVWSTTCPSCLKEMPLIKKLHQAHPKLKFVMLTVDDNQVSREINSVLEKNQLTDVEQWVFNEDNSEKLRYEIDPSWYGELPRTYFFSATQERTAISGALAEAKFETLLTKISP